MDQALVLHLVGVERTYRFQSSPGVDDGQCRPLGSAFRGDIQEDHDSPSG